MRTLVIITLIISSLAACGKKGDLKVPPAPDDSRLGIELVRAG